MGLLQDWRDSLTFSEISPHPTNGKKHWVLTLVLTLLWGANVLATDSIQEIRLSAILVSDESLAQELADRLIRGEDFATLASEYSKYPNASSDGDLGFVAISDLAKPLRSWSSSLLVGGISKPIPTDNGYFILKKTDSRMSAREDRRISSANSQSILSIVPMLVTLGLLIVLIIAAVKAARGKGFGTFRVLLGLLLILFAVVGTVGSLTEAMKKGFAPGHLSMPIFALILIVGCVRLLRKPQPTPDANGVVYSDFWPRLMSLLIDGAIAMAIVIPAQTFLSTLSLSLFTFANIGTTTLIYLASIFFLWKFGATPGKMAVGIKVMKLDLTNLTIREVLLRNSVDILFGILYAVAFFQLLNVLDFSMYSELAYGPRTKYMTERFPRWYEYSKLASHIWLFSEVIVLLFNKKRRAMHDFIARTVVVQKKTIGQRVVGEEVKE